MNRNHNHEDEASSSNTKRFKTCDDSSAAAWLKLNHDVLLLIMMKLGVFDFLIFSSVCKSWRSLALSNMENFMASRPPMVLWYEFCFFINRNYCYMKDFEGRTFMTMLPHRGRMTYFGSTCGFLIFFENSSQDFWLVNPIKRQQLHFPACNYARTNPHGSRAILVFSRSLSRWVFVISYRCSSEIWFSIDGKREWNHVFSSRPFLDLHAFKGKIYTLHTDCCLGEMRLNPNPELTFLETNNFPKPKMNYPELVSLGGNLYILNWYSKYIDLLLELDFGKMEWVSPDNKTTEEYTFFQNSFCSSAAIKPRSWADPQAHDKSNHGYFGEAYYPIGKSGKIRILRACWYFPHDCLKVNLIDE